MELKIKIIQVMQPPGWTGIKMIRWAIMKAIIMIADITRVLI